MEPRNLRPLIVRSRDFFYFCGSPIGNGFSLDIPDFWKRLLEVSFVRKGQTEVGTREIRPLDESQEDFFLFKGGKKI